MQTKFLKENVDFSYLISYTILSYHNLGLDWIRTRIQRKDHRSTTLVIRKWSSLASIFLISFILAGSTLQSQQ
jgi:hypothetical protein